LMVQARNAFVAGAVTALFVLGTIVTLQAVEGGHELQSQRHATSGLHNSHRQEPPLVITDNTEGKSKNYNYNNGAIPLAGNTLAERRRHVQLFGDDETSKRVAAYQCPPRSNLEDSDARKKYNNLLARYGTDGHALHEYSFYQMPVESWDLILKSHTSMLGYKKGDWVFESGSAAGSTLDSLQRQYGVRIAGADIAEELVDFATTRLNGKFCAANARDLSFIPSNLFDHSLAFAVYMYIGSVADMCKATKELLRIVKPGGTVFLGQINDQTRDALRSSQSEGPSTVGPLYWYRFAHDMGVSDVRVLRAGEVYSKRKVPEMDTYDLHATVRYNVYFRKPDTPLRFETTDCHAVESNVVQPRETVDGQPCHFPFYYKGVIFDDCTTVDDGNGREWCALERSVIPEQVLAGPHPSWGYCKDKPYAVRKDFWGV